MGMEGTLTKLAAIFVMGLVKAAVGMAVGPHQIAINTKGGCDMV
jgi:hypothetical protein